MASTWPLTKPVPASVVTLSAGAADNVLVVVVNDIALLVPDAVLTVSDAVPGSPTITSSAVAVVALETTTLPTMMPVPLAVTVVAPSTKFDPVRVTGTLVPRGPDDGLIASSAGTPGTTVNMRALLVPPAVLTVMLRGPGAALGRIPKVTFIEVLLEANTELMNVP